MRYRLLHDLATAPNGTNKTPVGVRLAILANCAVPQVHAILSAFRIARFKQSQQWDRLALHADSIAVAIICSQIAAHSRQCDQRGAAQTSKILQSALKLRKLG
jgi:hypothetical protein